MTHFSVVFLVACTAHGFLTLLRRDDGIEGTGFPGFVACGLRDFAVLVHKSS